jgi:hypothetical protein
MKAHYLLILTFVLTLTAPAKATFGRFDPVDMELDDLQVGGDIFSDFNEDLESAQVLEAERFYRYGRFFSFQLALGLTTFDGNRGRAFEDDHPTFGLGLNYFLDFQRSVGLGFEFSRHHLFSEEPTRGFPEPVGLMESNMLRVYFSYRYYIETANLGTAITYSNPYLTGRLEYWYLTNKFSDQTTVPNDNGGGLGFGIGFGLEFPIRLRESYIGLEFLFHTVNFHDKFNQRFKPVEPGAFGYDDLAGNVFSTMLAYVFNW